MYLAEKIDEVAFCDDFYFSYDLELDYDALTDEEQQTFSALGRIVDRFSEFEEDIEKYPGVFYTKEELKKKIIETKEKLKDRFEELKKDSDF